MCQVPLNEASKTRKVLLDAMTPILHKIEETRDRKRGRKKGRKEKAEGRKETDKIIILRV